jgi:hypothetical protein
LKEGAPVGHTLMSVAITDADADPFGGPFQVEIEGDGAEMFRFDKEVNLVTVGQLDHSKKDVYLLNVSALSTSFINCFAYR